MPIEINIIGPKYNRRKGKKQHRIGGKKVLTYYSYGKPGYFTRDYRSKGAIPKPQLNIIERKVSLESRN